MRYSTAEAQWQYRALEDVHVPTLLDYPGRAILPNRGRGGRAKCVAMVDVEKQLKCRVAQVGGKVKLRCIRHRRGRGGGRSCGAVDVGCRQIFGERPPELPLPFPSPPHTNRGGALPQPSHKHKRAAVRDTSLMASSSSTGDASGSPPPVAIVCVGMAGQAPSASHPTREARRSP